MQTSTAKHTTWERRELRPDDIDRWVGIRMRERRIMLGITQSQLADQIDCTYQQQHKREKGINRVSSGNLYKIAKALGVEVSYFFEGISDTNEIPQMVTHQRQLLELTRNFKEINDQKQRDLVSRLARDLAQSQ